MKRINPVTKKPYKRGDKHPFEELIFVRYFTSKINPHTGKFKELWVIPESFESIRASERQWQQANKDKRRQINALYYQSTKGQTK